MIKVEVNWSKDGIVEFGFSDAESGDENYVEDVAEELAKVMEDYLNGKEKKWKEFREKIWKQVDGFISRGGFTPLLISDFSSYNVDEWNKSYYSADFLKHLAKESELEYHQMFGCIKWWLEDIYEVPHKSEPFVIFENHLVTELTDL